MMVGLKRISAALGLLAAGAMAPGLASAQGPASNQATADAVAGALRSSPTLAGARIEVHTRGGQVTLDGAVASEEQKFEALTRAQQVPGVASLNDQIRVSGGSQVIPAQYQQRVALGHGHGHFGHHGGGSIGAPIDVSAAGPIIADGGMGMDGPLPEGPAGQPGATQAAMPGQPNYAWPSYAPYPNFSAVGYPTAYPWQAWPNIGPFYPYPEVPLDWRAVTLRWDDGIWWLDFKKHYTRPFFTPYPFGLFAY